MKELLYRTLTAILLLALLIGVWVFFAPKGMFVLVSAVCAGLLWEYYRLALGADRPLWLCRAFFLMGLSIYLGLFVFSGVAKARGGGLDDLAKFFIIAYVVFFVLAFWLLRGRGSKGAEAGVNPEGQHKSPARGSKGAGGDGRFLEELSLSFMSLFYVCLPCFLFLSFFIGGEPGRVFLMGGLCIVFSGDVCAYVGGRLLKGKKWLPAVSPGKTLSGLFCGLLAGGLAGGLFFYLKAGYSFPVFFIFGFLSFFIAQTGDLFISLLKRRAGVKNTGSFLPGHGGLLDRLDGLLPALPFMILCFEYFFLFFP